MEVKLPRRCSVRLDTTEIELQFRRHLCGYRPHGPPTKVGYQQLVLLFMC